MAKASPNIAALNSGEWSPDLSGRTDLQGYSASAYRCRNWLPTIEGPIIRRPATGHVRQAKTTNNTRLIPFIKARSDAVMIEMGPLYARFIVNREPVVTGAPVTITAATQADPVVITAAAHGYAAGQDVFIAGVAGMTEINGRWFRVANPTTNDFELQSIHGVDIDGTGYGAYVSGGTVDKPYEIATPYLNAALALPNGEFGLAYAQRGDVVYIVDRRGLYAPRKLSRTANNNWTLATLSFTDGPFEAINPDDSIAMHVSAVSGTGITITCDTSIFTDDDIGRLLRIDQEILTDVAPWEPAKTVSVGDYRRSQGNEYQVTAAPANTGTVPPQHTSGIVSDGDGRVDWEYISSGYIVAKITARTTGFTVTADVTVTGPQTIIGSANKSTLWRFSSWTGIGSHPVDVAFFRDRLCFASDIRVDMSVSRDYESFSPDNFGQILPESGVSIEVPGAASKIAAISGGSVLAVLTEGGEVVVSEQNGTDPFGPNNIKADIHTTYGASQVDPLRVGSNLLFVQASGKRVRGIRYAFDSDSFIAPDQTIRANHLTAPRLLRMTRQEEPLQTVWVLRSDGNLLSYAYDPTQEVRAWAMHTIGGPDAVVSDIATIPSPDGTVDDVWMVVSRTINGATRKYIEYMRPGHELGDAITGAKYCDSGLSYVGAAATLLRGFDHMEGEAVDLIVDGFEVDPVTVSDGTITLSEAGSVVQAGYRYASVYATNRLDYGAADGTSQAKTKRITDVAFRIVEGRGGSAGPSETQADTIPDLNYQDPATLLGSPNALFSGDVLMPWPGGYETEGRVWFINDSLFPCKLVSIMPQIVTQEAR